MSRAVHAILVADAHRRLMLALATRRDFPAAGEAMLDFAIVELAELDAIGERL